MELVDVYNERCEKFGYTKERKSLKDDEYRLSSFIWIINDNDKVLLQQRPSNTKKMPNMWGATAGGVVAGETSVDGAVRELKEELGIDIIKDELVFIGSYKRINDFVNVFLCRKNIEISDMVLNFEEVQDVRWFSIKEFEQMINDGIGIDTSFNVFKYYYHEFYDRHYEIVDGKPIAVRNRK